MPKTKQFGGKTFKKMRSFKTKAAAESYAKNCRGRGFNARVGMQSGPRVKNKHVVYADKR